MNECKLDVSEVLHQHLLDAGRVLWYWEESATGVPSSSPYFQAGYGQGPSSLVQGTCLLQKLTQILIMILVLINIVFTLLSYVTGKFAGKVLGSILIFFLNLASIENLTSNIWRSAHKQVLIKVQKVTMHILICDSENKFLMPLLF